MKVKDILNPVTDHVTPEDTLQLAVIKMREARKRDGCGVRGIIVLDGGENLIGVLSIKDILRAAIPVYLDTKLSKFSWDGMLEKMAAHVACTKVKEFMTHEVITISEDATLMTCADLLIKKNLQRLPVVNKENKVIGIVSISDIYNVISEIFADQPECKL